MKKIIRSGIKIISSSRAFKKIIYYIKDVQNIMNPHHTQPTEEEIQDQQLLNCCRQLQTELHTIKTLKLKSQIELYEQTCHQQLQQQLAFHTQTLNQQHEQKTHQLQQQHQQQQNKLQKTKEQILKQQHAFNTILQQLTEMKMSIDEEFKEKVQQVHEEKNRIIGEWKKMSNEEIMKAQTQIYLRHN